MSPQPQPRQIVLPIGAIPEFVYLRAQILRSAGYEVVSTTAAQEADLRMANEHYDVLLLCYSLSEDWQQRLIKHFRETHRHGRGVAISNVPYSRTPLEADEHIYGIEGPEALIEAVRGKAA